MCLFVKKKYKIKIYQIFGTEKTYARFTSLFSPALPSLGPSISPGRNSQSRKTQRLGCIDKYEQGNE